VVRPTAGPTRSPPESLLAGPERLGDGAVSWHIRGRGSERELVNEEAHTWTLHEGRIARFEWGQDVGKALEAAGVPE
jgi:hypothetical protein